MKRFLLIILGAFALAAQAREEQLVSLLQRAVEREQFSPDSVEQDIDSLEHYRLSRYGLDRAIVDICLGRMYSQNTYDGVEGKYMARSAELFREALSYKEELHAARAKDYRNLVYIGKNEKTYNGDMLYVAWCTMQDCLPDSAIMSGDSLISFYTSHSNLKPQQIKDKIARLNHLNDSIRKAAPSLSLHMAEAYYPGDSLHLDIKQENITTTSYIIKDENGKVVSKDSPFAPLQPGRYTLTLKSTTKAKLNSKPTDVKADFVVSRLQMLVDNLPGDSVRIRAVDAKSGKPVPEVTSIYDKKNHSARVVLDADSCLPDMSIYGRYSYSPTDSRYRTNTRIYTDRSIYRPGQKVEVAAIVYDQKHWDIHTTIGRSCTVQLLNANGEILQSKDVVTDSLGTLATEFTLPGDIQLGYCQIRTNGQTQMIRVEGYKRPEFYVTVKADTCTISGLAMNYNGTPLRAARVTGTLRRMCCWWWRRQCNMGITPLDTTYTDMDGRFSISIPVKALGRNGDFAYFPHIMAKISVLSQSGEEHSESCSLRLFPDPVQPAETAKKKEWVECPVDTFEVNSPAKLELRQRENRARYILLTAFSQKNVVIDTVLVTTDTLTTFTIPYNDSYQDGMLVNVAYVQDGIPHRRTITIYHRLPDNHLELHWDTFRDHTQPGAMQQWTMRITHTDGRAARANLMMTVYDASLDALQSYSMNMYQPFSHHIPYAGLRTQDPFKCNAQSQWQNFDLWYYQVPEYDYSHLRDELFGNTRYFVTVPMRMMYKTMAVNSVDALESRSLAAQASPQLMTVGSTETFDEADAQNNVTLRTDFSETAMFKPQLRTDADGKVAICFKLPESLTRWRIMGLAHTIDMCFGMIDDTLQVTQALMAQLHLPRYLRQGDDATYTATVNNNSTSVQSGKVQIIIRDAKNQKVLKHETLNFNLPALRDTTYTLEYYAPEGVDGIAVSITAKGQKDSDGEQREIPVLSALASLSTTEALTLQPGESRVVDIQQMFPLMATDKQVIIEQNQDPVQAAINTLPTVIRPNGENALSYASAYYAAVETGNEMALPYMNKVASMQNADGSMSWYKGMYASDWITCEVGYLLVRAAKRDVNADRVLSGIKNYLTVELQKSIKARQKQNNDWTTTLSDLETLYILLHDNVATTEQKELAHKMLKHVAIDEKGTSPDYLATLLVVQHDLGETKKQDEALGLLHRQLTHSDGTYIAYRGGYYPGIDNRIETQTKVMEALWTVTPQDSATIRSMQHWLLQQKRTQQWNDPVGSIDAIYALAKGNHELLRQKPEPLKRDTIDILRQRSITVTNKRKTENWISVYATYTMPEEQVEAAANELSVSTEIVGGENPQIGGHVTLRTNIMAGLDYNFVELTIPRPAGLEPVNQRSGLTWWDGLQSYRQIADDHTVVSISILPHGTYIINEECVVQRAGTYSTGVPSAKCVYAPEYQGHGENEKLKIKNLKVGNLKL